jgi:hypothetical protein
MRSAGLRPLVELFESFPAVRQVEAVIRFEIIYQGRAWERSELGQDAAAVVLGGEFVGGVEPEPVANPDQPGLAVEADPPAGLQILECTVQIRRPEPGSFSRVSFPQDKDPGKVAQR